MGIQGKILIIDDEPEALENCRRILSRLDYDCLIERDSWRAVERLERERPGLVLTDLRMPGLDGIGVLNAAKGLDPEIQVVLLTAYSSVETAVMSLRKGAFDYLTKPFSSAQLEDVTRRAFGERQDIGPQAGPERGLPKPIRPAAPSAFRCDPIIGESAAMKRVGELIRKVAPTSSNILIYGESGTGKELVARAIHAASGRAGRAFVPVDCAALPDTLLESELFGHERGAFTGAHASKPGLFEIADGGTVFLDEVSAMSEVLQSRLLRVLQERQVRRVGGTRFVNIDVRIVAASNRDLEAASRAAQFRHDLYYRLNVIQLALPPLRAREGDIPLLAKALLARRTNSDGGLSRELDADVLDIFSRYQWPGNVRELQNVIERAAALADGPIIRAHHLPETLRHQSSWPAGFGSAEAHESTNGFKEAKEEVVRSFERQFLLDLLKRHHGHMGRVAKDAGVDRKTIERMVKKHDLRGLF